ncbi:hypothetical protein [Lewinella sp. IMCC34191]|uniref:hypothetical protein n=1 Tax=Lewinella sp. IMCC34191 TaxID=2259172 RepID=UPI000E2616F3|nr:hypothetical protein [Lewinella sp. IMCC34191]
MQKFFIFFLSTTLLTACGDLVEDFSVDDVRLEAEYAVPLVDSRVNLPELIGEIDEQVTLTIDPDGLLRFNYADTVPPVTGDALFTELRNLAGTLPLPITSRSRTIPFPLPGDVELNVLRLKSGRFSYSLPNTYDVPVTVELTFPTLSRNGTPLQISGQLPAYSGTGAPPTLTNLDDPLDLSEYELDFSSGSITVNYAIDGPDGQEFEPADGTITLLAGLDFSYLEGYFGVQSYAGVDEVLRIDFFDNYLGGDISFVKPRITVTVRNSFGVPSRAIVDELYVTTVDGDTLPVTGSVVEEGFAFDYPERPGNDRTTSYVIDETNSNVLDLIAAKPVALYYRISARINPDADTSVKGFLVDTSSYTATVKVELPLYGSADDFQIRDSFPVNLGDQYGDITSASLRVTTDNEIPFDLSLTGTFTDEQGNALADLTDGELLVIQASPVDADGNATGVQQQTTDIAFTGEKLDAIRRATTLVLRTTFATTDGGTKAVRVLDEQDLRVRIGARLSVQNL